MLFTNCQKMEISRKFKVLFPNIKDNDILTPKNKIAIILGRKTEKNALVARKKKLINKALAEEQKRINKEAAERKEILKSKKNAFEQKMEVKVFFEIKKMEDFLKKEGKTLRNKKAVLKYLNDFVLENPNHLKLRVEIRRRILLKLARRYPSIYTA